MLVVSISLNNYMPFENKKGKKYFHFGEYLSNYIPAEKKIRKNKNSEDFLLNTKQVFSIRNSENFSGEYGR